MTRSGPFHLAFVLSDGAGSLTGREVEWCMSFAISLTSGEMKKGAGGLGLGTDVPETKDCALGDSSVGSTRGKLQVLLTLLTRCRLQLP